MTKRTFVTHAELTRRFSYDEMTGEFRLRVGVLRHGRIGEDPVRHDDFGNGFINIDSQKYAATRVAWFYVTGRWPTRHVRCIDRDRSNIAFSNLKEGTRIYTREQAPRKQEHGVSWDEKKKKWQAVYRTAARYEHLGYFDDIEEARAIWRKTTK